MSNVTCGNCKFSHNDITPENLRGNLQCRFQPPQLVAVTIKTAQGGALVPAGLFPTVHAGWFCGQGVIRPPQMAANS